ncbi:hypothetical protein [Streptomyces flavofungini]|uniref:hypothetical protein n=1 Tax=Streptomyces flavofungini TaxID=68200 RepID=UPI0025B02AE8|nr:hypothetical protein [Streptomyces flavofungini]WJV50976.1 hypothetical protein QUY26_39025 [Streptomyces flavofungini]
MRSTPRRVVVDGQPMIAVSEKELESLLATRRQLGSQTTRMRMLRDTLLDMGVFLDDLAEALDRAAPADPRESPRAADPPYAGLALTTELRQRARQARVVAGSGRPGRGRPSPARPGHAQAE